MRSGMSACPEMNVICNANALDREAGKGKGYAAAGAGGEAQEKNHQSHLRRPCALDVSQKSVSTSRLLSRLLTPRLGVSPLLVTCCCPRLPSLECAQ